MSGNLTSPQSNTTHTHSAADTVVTLAFDIGGSKTQAVRTENGRVVAETIVGSANVSSMGIEEAGRQLDAAIAALGGADGVHAVLAGSAGVDTEASQQRLKTLLVQRLPDAEVGVVHDTHLILAAAGVDEGIALISGTGAVAWGVTATDTARAGGWGHLLGDEGSGYWVAREAVRRALHDLDVGRPATVLTDRLVAECGVDEPFDLLDHFYTRADRQYWAGRARVVFELAAQGDRRSEEIIDTAAAALGELVVTVATRLRTTGPVVLAGGQAVNQPELQRRVAAILAEHHITDIRILDVDPVHGAVRLAHSLLRAV